MSESTRDDVLTAVNPIDDATIAEIIATGITPQELKQACVFVGREFKTHEHREIPLGRVGRVISIIERVGAKPLGGSPLGEAGSTLE